MQVSSHTELLSRIRSLQKQQSSATDNKLDDLYVLERWLSSCGQDIELPYPVSFALSEKPDVVLHSGDRTISIEVTKFLAKQRARATKIANHMGVGHSPSRFEFDSPNLTNKQIEGMVGDIPFDPSSWRETRSPLRMYAEKILGIVTAKAKKVIQEATCKCSYNILVIEDHHHLANYDRSILARRLRLPAPNVCTPEIYCFDEVWFSSAQTSQSHCDAPIVWKHS